jgi:hypothetical protein
MIIALFIGGLEYTATVAPHQGSDVSMYVVRVDGPHLGAPAEYAGHPRDYGGRKRWGEQAIRYTVDNIVLPMLAARIEQMEATNG